jgi:hypothetical protein
VKDRLVFTCGEAADRFSLYLDRELAEREAFGLDTHLSDCAPCQRRVGELAELDRDLARLSTAGGSDEVTAILAKARWEEAAAARRRRAHRAAPEPGRAWALPFSLAAAALLCLAAAAARPVRPASVPRKPAAVRADAAHVPDPAPLPSPPRPAAEPKAAPGPAPLPEPHRGEPNGPTRPPAPPVPLILPTAPVEAPPTLAPGPAVTARLVEGVASIDGAPAPAGAPIGAGQSLSTDAGPASVLCLDGTRLSLGPAASIAFASAGKTISVARGEIAADVAPQPKDGPLRFVTPQAEVIVLGTLLAIAARPESVRVEVEKGRVEVRRRRDGWKVEVRGGHQVVVSDGAIPLVRPLAANLLADPGFDSGGKGWSGIWNQAMGRNFGGISVEPFEGRGGAAVRMVASALAGYDREVYQDFPVSPAETIEAAGWIRTDRLGGNGARASLLWLAGPSAIEGSVALRSKGMVVREETIAILSGTRGWVRVSGRAQAPAGTRQARLVLYTDIDPDGAGTAWFDDWCLRRIGKSK